MDQDFSQDIKHATVKSFVDGLSGHRQTSEVLGLHGSADAYLLAEGRVMGVEFLAVVLGQHAVHVAGIGVDIVAQPNP